jgi:hypothetical protein
VPDQTSELCRSLMLLLPLSSVSFDETGNTQHHRVIVCEQGIGGVGRMVLLSGKQEQPVQGPSLFLLRMFRSSNHKCKDEP